VVVTGEGTVDETTFEGKAPAVVQQRSRSAGVRCVLFGGRVISADAIPLSGDPNRAYADLIELGMRLGRDHATR
jgi:Glycerate kinase family